MTNRINKKLSDIAVLVEGTLLGTADPEICGVTNIEDAGAQDITFAVPPHLNKAAASKAAAVIIPDTVTEFSKPAIRVGDPRVAFTKLLEIFSPPPAVQRGVHPTAVIGKGARLGSHVAIMPHVVIAARAVIGHNTVIYPHSYIGEETVIGQDAILYPNVTIRERCRLGDRVIIHSGAVIGSDGFGFVTIDGQHHKVPQIGNVVLGDDVEVGANTAIDRATTGSTIVKRGTKIDNFVHLAHNVVVGEDCLFVAFAGISGSTRIGNQVTFAGQTGCAGHLTIGDHCVFAARSAVTGNVPPGSFYAGFPARPHQKWLRVEGAVHKLPELVKKIRALEKRLASLEGDAESLM